MRYVFICSFVFLVIASTATYLSLPEQRSEAPIIRWATDPNPARKAQVERFHQWLEDNDYPEIELRLDTASRGRKMLIQGVSGIASDILGHIDGSRLRYYHQVGLLDDVTEKAKRLGFSPQETWAPIRPNITHDGRQYTFPCNVAARLYWVNKRILKKYDVEIPDGRWSVERFEELGRKFVRKANEGLEYPKYFFSAGIQMLPLYRSMGLDVFNETQTRCILDDSRYEKALKLRYKWTYEDHILPTSRDRASFATESGYGGSALQLFNQGNYATVWIGRYGLIQFRQFGDMDLTVVEPPHAGFPNTSLTTRAAAVYRGGDNKDLAAYFLAYLASEEYNMTIVEDADALPPNPKYTRTEEYLRPEDYPNEWGIHRRFADAARNIAIARPFSPFVLGKTVQRIQRGLEDGVQSDVYSPNEAAAIAADRINSAIKRNLREYPAMEEEYNRRLALQEKIDARRKNRKKVPLKWITNPFYRRYYLEKGWALKRNKEIRMRE